jgi:hypothetical protein
VSERATHHEATREAVVIGYGFEYLVMALNCGRSIRASNPGLATTLITNISVDATDIAGRFDRVIVRDEPSDRNRLVKTSVLDHALADHVLYVDADSEVVGDLDPAFRLLERFDVGLKAHTVPVNKPFELAPGIPGGTFTHFAGGMLLLRSSPEARDFLAHWQRRMVESDLSRDQPSLARTVYDLPHLRLVVLNAVWCSDEWELATLFDPSKHERPRILHHGQPEKHPAYAARVRYEMKRLKGGVAAQPVGDAEVARVMEKYRRITHPLFAGRLTRRLYIRLAHWRGMLRGSSPVDLRDRAAVARGRPYTRDAGRLWED